MQLTERFIKNISDQELFQKNDHLLLAVSGGVDSMVLCELCKQAGFSFTIAHVNFQLRGEDSEGDEKLVRSLAGKYNVEVLVKSVDTTAYASVNNVSIQVAARQFRYDWFDQLLSTDIKWLLTAHHADDNIETMMMNFFRGTGIRGLRGILPKYNRVIRPLLPFHKEEIILFAKENSLLWREDISNQSDKYSRNYFRNTIIPLVKKKFPEAEQNLTANLNRFGDVETLYWQSIDRHKKKLLNYHGREVHIPILRLAKLEPLETIVYEIIKSFDFSSGQLPDVLHLINGEQGKFVESSTHRIIKNRKWLIITPNDPSVSDNIIIEEGASSVHFGNGEIKLSVSPKEKISLSVLPATAQFDLEKIEFPLMLRKWKQGDYFYPLGMPKKKKVARFLIDQKLSPTQKEEVWVMESNCRICWVAGMRIDDRFKLTDKTSRVLTIEIKG